jgi:hypothetical protein
MILKTLAILAVLSLVIALFAAIGLYKAYRENTDLIEGGILTDAPITIDLSPEVYADLPDPVRRYFDYAFSGQTSITLRGVDWDQSGDFMLPVVGQFRAEGRQVSRPNTPVYAFTGWFWRFGLPLIESRDAFFVDHHNMRAKLLGWKTVMHTDYTDPAQIKSLHSYLILRYYGQATLMPWALLPNEYVTWDEHDADTAYLTITHGDLEGRYIVRFAPNGAITVMEGDRLLMEGNGTLQREVGQKSNYQTVNGFMVPTHLDYRWFDKDDELISRFKSRISNLKILR